MKTSVNIWKWSIKSIKQWSS